MLYVLDSLISRILDTWKTTIQPCIKKVVYQLRHAISSVPEKFGFNELLNVYSDPEMDLEHGMPLVSERIKVLTMSKIQESKTQSRTIVRHVLLAAAFIVVMTISVFAAGTGAEWFVSFFAARSGTEMASGQVDYISDHTVDEGQSQTVNGYTVTLKSYFSEDGIYYLKFDVQAPAGEKLPKIIFGDWQLCQNGKIVELDYGEWRQLEADENAGWGSYLAIIEGATTKGDRLQAVLTDLEDFNEVGVVIAVGQWRFDLEASESYQIELVQDSIIPIQARTLNGESFEVRITSAKLGAMKLEIEYDMPDPYVYTEHEFDDVKAILQDGNTIVLVSDFMHGSNESEDIHRSAYFSAKVPLALNEVVCIEFPGGAKVLINTEE